MKAKVRLSLGLLISVLGIAVSTGIQAAEGEDGFKSIFNGQDLTGWEGNPEFWSIEDGAITGRTTPEKPTRGNTFLIWRQGTVDDFELKLSYRIIPNNDADFANSGIQYRSREMDNWVVGGYQADFEAGPTYSGILYEERGRGILAQRGQMTVVGDDGKPEVVGSLGESSSIQAQIKKEDWNEYKIIARGNHLTHVINGRVTVNVTDMDSDKRAYSGILALQLHAGRPMTVQFKDIRLKRLPLSDGRKKVVLVAGKPSHRPGEHEHNAGVQLFHKCLQTQEHVLSTFYLNGWPSDPTAFDNADSILFYADGGAGHPAIQGDHLQILGRVLERGVGLVNIHYAVEVPKDRGGQEFLDWAGGYFETYWSVNPHWTADFESLPDHPITAGVDAFEMRDEWYYHMRFPEEMEGVSPILSDVPPASTLSRPDGPHSGNPHVRAAVEKGEPQHVAWAYERPNGGRGFGFTGGHFHKNWGAPHFRKLVLNAILWTAKAKVPAEGVECEVTEEDLAKNLDPKGRR